MKTQGLIALMVLCVLSVPAHAFRVWPYGKATDSVVTRYPLIHSFSVTAGAKYLAPSVEDEIREEILPENKIKVSSTVPVSFRYSFSFTDPRIPHYLPVGYQGVAVGVLNIGAMDPHGLSNAVHNIGYPVVAYVFQGGPFHSFNDKLSLNYEWNFGASFGWKPYSERNKNYSIAVGSRVNAYLNLGLSLNWKLNSHTSLFGGVDMSHFSNGNTSFPNPGVNSMGLRIGMIWTLNPEDKKEEISIPEPPVRKKLEYDIMAWGATRKRLFRGIDPPVLLPGHYACAGVSFSPMVRLNSWWRVGGALDLQWDRSSDMKRNYLGGETTEDIRFTTPSFWRQSTVGISVHGELQMPIFAVNVGCGYNIVAPWENRGTYQNIALKTYLCERFFINIGYQLRNFQQQSSLMLGAGVTI